MLQKSWPRLMEMQVRFVQSVSFESTKLIYIDLHMFSYIRLQFQKCIIDTLGIFKDFNGHLFYCLHVKVDRKLETI